MIGILDPALFEVRDPQQARQEIDAINRMCRYDGVRIPRLREYWPRLWDEFGRAFEMSLAPADRNVIQMLHKGSQSEGEIPLLDESTLVWRSGFDEMFGHLPGDWEQYMLRTVARAAWTGQEVVLLTRAVVGRNVRRHSAQDVALDEITRWMLYVQCKGQNDVRRVRCVHHRRNLMIRWTMRFDWRLPAVADRAKYPFCPPRDWWRNRTTAFRTVEGKPAWVDDQDNGWARPNIAGGAHHWDVFIRRPTLEQRIGLSQINVVEFGSPEGEVGHIHHVPADKKPHLRDLGWSCP